MKFHLLRTPQAPPDRPDPARDFLFRPDSGKRSILWYETYSTRERHVIRSILRHAVEQATQSTTVQIAVRVLPPTTDEQAVARAHAVVAAGWQGAFLGMHLLLTSDAPPHDKTGFLDAARTLGLDLDKFETDLDSDQTKDRIEADRKLALASGHTWGPLLFIDGRIYSGVYDEAALTEALERPLGLRIHRASIDFFHWAAAGGLVLILATFAALMAANLGAQETYKHIRDSVLSIGWNDALFSLSVQDWVNDGLMTIFFLIVGIEIKRELVWGELSVPSRAALPIAAAIGGMAMPAGLFALLNIGQDTVHGWGIPMSTDIAFTLGLLALLGTRVSSSLKVFVSALAIADDLGAIVVIAFFYSTDIAIDPLIVAVLIFAAMVGLNRAKVYALWPYLLFGTLLWASIFASGLHATLAGVLTALAIPSRSSATGRGIVAQTNALMRAESERADSGGGVAAQTVERLTAIVDRLNEPGVHLQRALENWTNFLILPLFAFFNTGLVLIGFSFDATAPAPLGVFVGLVFGKPLGICLATWIALKSGVATKSDDINWHHLIGAGCLAGIGFTMSIFVADSAFQDETLNSVKLSILLASSFSAVLGMGILWRASSRK
ncbi:Na+/H+ antiporter NhaA [Rhodobacteraceae bacterium KMM 6894]|nr:Na+/H+ antiporter NhaA [Rhodobacteraceae bacterium KMM 6894]